jgi:predicted Zn-dependent protease
MKNKKIEISKLFLLLTVCFFLSACETLNVNYIGEQRQFVIENDERRLWKRCEEDQNILLKSGFIYEDKDLAEYLNILADKLLLKETKETGLNIKVYVLKDPSINAFMYPNGIMFVHTGLLANAENEAQIATILGHEITHFIKRHSLKNFRNIKNASAFFSTLIMTNAALSRYSQNADLTNLLLQHGFLSSITGYSRDMEYEADEGGFSLLAKNEYDTGEAPRVFEALERDIKEEKRKEPFAYSDHPHVKDRIRNFSKLCKNYTKSGGGEQNKIIGVDIYNLRIKNLLLDNAIMDIKMNRFKSANRAIDRYLKLEPKKPEGYFYLGELFRNRKEAGDLEKAIDNYKKAIEIDNNFAAAHRELGFLYYKEKRNEEATKEFETYLSLASTVSDVNYIRGYLDKIHKKGEK